MAVLGWPKTLNWTHFGKPRTSVPLAYGGSHTDCHIEIDIAYSWQGTRRLTPGGDYALREVKVVVKTNSLDTWVIAGVPTASNQARVLKHEQGHYNIAGITARDVERALAALRNSDSNALEAEATSVADAIIASGQTEEDTYDSDAADGGTEHGNDVAQQATWNSQIAAAKSLDDLP
jgi:hypothetical protein